MLEDELLLAAGALDPLAAPLLGAALPLVDPDPLALVEPEAGALLSVEDEEELELGELGVTVAEPDAEPDGALGGVLELVEPEDAPEPGVRVTARSPSLSQPASNPAPSARDTATAKVESLICRPPWLGYD